MTVSESLLQIAELTKKNLQILEVLNDSFFTKSSHLSTVVGDTTYIIPSYIALENKVNHIQDAFNNLVHSAKTGEAWFNFDGNSKEIAVRGYQSAPNPIDPIIPSAVFGTETKNLFKDMLTPQPYLSFDVSAMPDDINSVIVKKIALYDAGLINDLFTNSDKGPVYAKPWEEIVNPIKSLDKESYVEYETKYDLEVRDCPRYGEYIIEKIISDKITEDLENILEIQFRDKIESYSSDNGSNRSIRAGEFLTTYDGSAKFEVISIGSSNTTAKLKVVSGEYVNPVEAPHNLAAEQVSDYSKLRYFNTPTTTRILHVPLEEDRYIILAIAPYNSRLNTRSPWSSAIIVDTDQLKLENLGTPFRDYYNANVTNIGDALIELSTTMFPAITKYSAEQKATLLSQPKISGTDVEFGAETLQVVQINKHLNDSDTVKNIRSLYSQKKQYQLDLTEIQDKIASLTSELAKVSFDDMSGIRTSYTSQIAELKDQQHNIVASINKIIDSISIAANDSEVPIENGKFRIRGYVDVEKYAQRIASVVGTPEEVRNLIIGVQCKYRYKNPSIPQANVSVINDFLFTEWNEYNPSIRERRMSYSNGQYSVKAGSLNDEGKFDYSSNDTKFNQIDIPITQGEIVEVKCRIIYGNGYPLVTFASEWSDVVTIEFPPELAADVEVLTIIEENNSDIETNRFDNILSSKGITTHTDDSIVDQDIKYFHKPESISSGFYTEERRIIPLKDKLIDMNSQITEILDMIQGTTSESISVSMIINGTSYELDPDVNNVIQLPSYNSIEETDERIPSGDMYKKGGVVYASSTFMIANKTQHTINLFSMYPGPKTKNINELIHRRWRDSDFGIKALEVAATPTPGTPAENVGTISVDAVSKYQNIHTTLRNMKMVWFGYEPTNQKEVENAYGKDISDNWSAGDTFPKLIDQRANQIITFNAANPYDGSILDVNHGVGTDKVEHDYIHDHYIHSSQIEDRTTSVGERINTGDVGLWVYPVLNSEFALSLDTDAVNAKYTMTTGTQFRFPIFIEYKLDNINSTRGSSATTFTFGVSIRPSLYLDPIYYQVQLVAKYNQISADLIRASKSTADNLVKYNVNVR